MLRSSFRAGTSTLMRGKESEDGSADAAKRRRKGPAVTAESHRIFRDLTNLSTFLIPRQALPELPEELRRGLGFVHGTESS